MSKQCFLVKNHWERSRQAQPPSQDWGTRVVSRAVATERFQSMAHVSYSPQPELLRYRALSERILNVHNKHIVYNRAPGQQGVKTLRQATHPIHHKSCTFIR